jgi:hypothetical protein
MLQGYRVDGINVVEMQSRNLRITLQNMKQLLEEQQGLATQSNRID